MCRTKLYRFVQEHNMYNPIHENCIRVWNMNFKTLKENYNTWGTEKNIKSGILPLHTVLSTVLVKSKVRYILTIFPTFFFTWNYNPIWPILLLKVGNRHDKVIQLSAPFNYPEWIPIRKAVYLVCHLFITCNDTMPPSKSQRLSNRGPPQYCTSVFVESFPV